MDDPRCALPGGTGQTSRSESPSYPSRARETGKRLATLSIDTEIRFRSAAERAQFSSELTAAITQLAARYHDASAPGGRTHRLVLVAHPLPQKNKETAV